MICAECGAILPDATAQCPHCGHAAGAPPPARPPAMTAEEREFERRLYRFPPVTATLLGLCVLIWLGMELVGSSEDPTLLLIFGAKHAGLILQGEVWRLISASFLHIGWKHLLFNGIALGQLGLFCENIFGRGRFIGLFLLTGVGGFALAAGFSDAISAGASASLFGLMGAMLVFGWRHRKEIPPFFQRLFTWMLLPWVVLNLGIGGIIANVDNLAHIGGLVSGVALALILGNHIVGEGSDADRSAGLPLGIAGILLTIGVGARVSVDVRDLLPVAQGIEAAAEEGDVAAVIAGWGALIDAKPGVGLFYANRGQARILVGDVAGADADLTEAIELNHSPASTRNQLAWLLTTRQDPSEKDINRAIRLARRSVAQRRGADNLNTLGWALYLRGEYAASQTYLDDALKMAEEQGLWGRAVEAVERLVGVEPQEVAAFDLYMLAMVHARQGDADAAASYLSRGDAAAEILRPLLSEATSAVDRLAADDELATLDAIAGQAHALTEAPPPHGAPGSLSPAPADPTPPR